MQGMRNKNFVTIYSVLKITISGDLSGVGTVLRLEKELVVSGQKTQKASNN